MKLIAIFLLAASVFAQSSFQRLSIIPKQDGSDTGNLLFRERHANGINYVGFKAPATIAADVIWQLPDADGTAAWCLKTNGAAGLYFEACGSGTGTGDLPVVDTTSLVKGSADATKVMRFEVDGITTATTRVLTVPDADVTLVGRENAETLSGAKTFSSAVRMGSTRTFIQGRDGANTHWFKIIRADGTVPPEPGSLIWGVQSDDGETVDSLAFMGGFDPYYEGQLDLGITRYWRTTRTYNIDAAPAGIVNNYTKVRKLEIADSGGLAATFWDIQSQASEVNSTLLIRDNAGASVLQFERKLVNSPLNLARFYTDLVPDTTSARSIGNQAIYWLKLWADNADIRGTLTTGYVALDRIYLTGVNPSGVMSSWWPLSNATYDLGSADKQWRDLYLSGAAAVGSVSAATGNFTTLVVGSCSGCGLAPNMMTTDTVQTVSAEKTFTALLRGSAADFAPALVSGISAYTRVRNLELLSYNGLDQTAWKVQADASLSASQFRVINNSGANELVINRTDAAGHHATFLQKVRSDVGYAVKNGGNYHDGLTWTSNCTNGSAIKGITVMGGLVVQAFCSVP